MTKELKEFENQHLAVMSNYAAIETQIKELTEKKEGAKAKLQEAMEKHDIKSIDNDILKATYVEASSTTSIDLKKMEKEEPKLHGELMEDYPKTSNRKAQVRITVR